MVKNPSVNTGDARAVGRALEEERAAHSNILAWRILWTEKPGGPQSMWLQRFEHNCAAEHTPTQLKVNRLSSAFDYMEFCFMAKYVV